MQKIFFLLLILITAASIQAQKSKLHFVTKEVSRIAVNTNYTYHFDAKDSAGNAIIYRINNLPGWSTYNEVTKTISGKALAAGQYLITIDAHTKTDTAHQPFMLTVYDKTTTNILCLGNSITNGVDTFNSFRRDLWQLLHADNYNFDFIGSWSKHHMGSNVPVPDFDMDHEGHSGWNFRDILQPPSWDKQRGNLYSWIKTYTPDIVLMELGTNDVFQCRKTKDMLNNLTTIVALLRGKNPNVKIFIAQIPPLGKQWADKKLCGVSTTYADAVNDLNKQIPLFAKQHSTIQSPIIVVDQYTGFDATTNTFDAYILTQKVKKLWRKNGLMRSKITCINYRTIAAK